MKLHRILLHASAGAVTLALALFLGNTADAQVQIQINGQPVSVEPAPVMQAGRVFVPLRGVFESLGASVVYSNGQINATGNGREISLHIGSTQATVDGSPQTIDVAPFIIGASTFVPLRFVSQALGANVDWDGTNHIVAITMQGAPSGSQGENGYQGPPPPSSYEQTSGDWIDTPPPPLPDYETPPVPEPNYIWVPGYWAWGYGGYYYVPGTWVEAPQPGLVWTPGYWGYQNGYYGWHEGYWAQSVGFYGGVYYGGGYYGNGYVGGRWSGNSFQYNTAVVQVNTQIIRNVYVDQAVVVRYPTSTRASYNGGPHGIPAKPTAQELTVTHLAHKGMTATQQQHVQVAGQDRRLLSSVNGGKPPIVVTPHAFTAEAKPAGFVPVTAEDKTAAQKLIVHPTTRPAVAVPVKTAPPRERPAVQPAIKPAQPTPAPVRPTARPEIVRPLTTRPPIAPTAPVRPAIVRTSPPRPVIAPTPVPRPLIVRPTPAPAVATAPPRPAVQAEPTRAPVLRTLPPRPRPTPPPKPRPTETP